MSMAAEAAIQAGLRAAISPSNMDRGDFIPTQMKADRRLRRYIIMKNY